jgi:hypothetical protein
LLQYISPSITIANVFWRYFQTHFWFPPIRVSNRTACGSVQLDGFIASSCVLTLPALVRIYGMITSGYALLKDFSLYREQFNCFADLKVQLAFIYSDLIGPGEFCHYSSLGMHCE